MENNLSTNENIFKSNMTYHAIRLVPDLDLYKEIKSYLKKNDIKAACIISCVGSLKEINIRTATGSNYINIKDNYEIVSLVGCISVDRCHLHISLGDKNGNTLSGHLLDEDNIVFTTAEIIIGEFTDIKFSQEYCNKSGWNELKIQNKTK